MSGLCPVLSSRDKHSTDHPCTDVLLILLAGHGNRSAIPTGHFRCLCIHLGVAVALLLKHQEANSQEAAYSVLFFVVSGVAPRRTRRSSVLSRNGRAGHFDFRVCVTGRICRWDRGGLSQLDQGQETLFGPILR